ncbi:MAG TPA: response regulator transcription factor [Candidatus Krumholzibacteria bacterium]|nr:response regulator transcription factor [Candidatus Krumholzibacteria bacterium]HPD72661.1 response regulator transcription factor [Candidatus Krumholzibacteria bacterium]HRY40407.1 response regulator transcription factor [Candidatus Krumholzibacteria bacterium]
MNESVPTSKRLLIIEDDQELIDLLSLHLESEGFQVVAAADGEAGLHAFQDGTYAIVILDWMLPSMSGLEVLREIRSQDSRTPVLMLTARTEEADKVLGLELGCDDYMTKPFSVRELAARVKVLRRRIERAEELARIAAGDQILDLGPLKIDHGKRKVEVRGEPIQLTVKEYDLLHTLAARPGRTFSRRQLLDLVWDQDSDIYEHTVNSHINRLRNKIEENPNRPRLILTVWGIGYRFTEDYL